MTAPDRPWQRYYDDPDFEPGRLVAPSMADLLAGAARGHARSPAYSCVLPGGAAATLSFADIARLSDACAFFLREDLGLAPGDAVAIMAPNCLAYPVAAYGILKAGLVLTGINPLYTPGEANFQLRDSGAKALFVIDLFGDRLAGTLKDTAVRQVIRLSIADLFPAPRRLLIKAVLRHVHRRVPPMTLPAISFRTALARGRRLQGRRPATDLARDRTLDDPAVYQYTGGTTGRPKGAELSERNLLANITQADHLNRLRLERMREGMACSLLVLPLYHVYALAIGGMHAMRLGTHVVLVPDPRPLSNLRAAFDRFDITVLPGTHALYAGLLEEEWFVARPPPSLKLCFSGAAPLAAPVRERWQALTGCRIYEGYGLTEGTCIIASSPLDASSRPGTVGVPLPGTDIRIVDEAGRDLPPGEEGEILVRGPQVMRGYLGRPDATAESIRDGWLHTGDIGRLDADGFLTILDRRTDLILVSGFNVYPAEIEAVLLAHDGIAEAAVVGAPDPHAGQVPWAFIVPRDGAGDLDREELARHCAMHLTNYKRPRRYLVVDSLPKSPVGKILRRELRAQVRP